MRTKQSEANILQEAIALSKTPSHEPRNENITDAGKVVVAAYEAGELSDITTCLYVIREFVAKIAKGE